MIFAIFIIIRYNIIGDLMYTIKNNTDNTIIIKKSKFITKLYRINSISEINNIIEKLKIEYKDATHVCYAYIIDGIQKCDDNGEPSGTAGLPILNVLKHNNLNFILCVVIRYFGGIKLGAGGLVRAYASSVTEALNITIKKEIIKGINITITFSYDNNKLIDNIVKNWEVINRIYTDNVTYNINLSKEEFEDNKIKLNKICHDIIINHDIIITK